jgi:hypothetical protein
LASNGVTSLWRDAVGKSKISIQDSADCVALFEF